VGSGSAGKRKNAIVGQFASRPIAMLESPAYRVLSLSAHRALARIEIEHAHHGGKDNGRLPVTYIDFETYGIHRRVIAPAIRELEALGFVEVTQRGCAGNAEFRQPSLYRITYRHAHDAAGDGTHEWRAIKTDERAEEIANSARLDADPKAVTAGKKRNPGGRKCRVSVAETATGTPSLPVAETATTAPPYKLPLLSISRDISREDTRSALPQSAVASVSSKTTKTNEPAKIPAIEMIMKTQQCNFHEAAELFEELPARALEPADD
jgi:hypothetical protein